VEDVKRKSRKRIWIWLLVLLLLAALCWAAFHFGFVSIDDARHIQFNLNSNA
jgi:hypothetical protein